MIDRGKGMFRKPGKGVAVAVPASFWIRYFDARHRKTTEIDRGALEANTHTSQQDALVLKQSHGKTPEV